MHLCICNYYDNLISNNRKEIVIPHSAYDGAHLWPQQHALCRCCPQQKWGPGCSGSSASTGDGSVKMKPRRYQTTSTCQVKSIYHITVSCMTPYYTSYVIAHRKLATPSMHKMYHDQKKKGHRISYLVLTTDIPNSEANVLVLNSFNIKSCSFKDSKFSYLYSNEDRW